MEGRRDATHQNFHSPPVDLEDDGCLELSLGLSCGGSRSKGKGSDGLCVVPEVTAETVVYAEGTLGKAKYGRGSGLDAALKKFLEGPLDEQEESCRVLDAQQQGPWEVSGSCNKDVEKSMFLSSQGNMKAIASHDVQVYQEKVAQRELVFDFDTKRNPELFNEIHLLSGEPTALGQSYCQGIPSHFIDVMKNGSSAVGLATVDGDNGELQRAIMQREELEQQRKSQEARKKRKCLIEEHKQQKNIKKEGVALHGFRRPGSNSWLPGLDATAHALDAERGLLALSENEDGEEVKEIRGALHSGREKAVGCSETEQGESTGTHGDDVRGVEMNFIPRLTSKEADKISGVPNRGISDVLNSLQAGGNRSIIRMADNIPDNVTENGPGPGNLPAGETSSPSQQQGISASKSERVSGQSNSTGSDVAEEKEEQSFEGDGEASSAPPASVGSDTAALASSDAPLITSGPITSAALPYPLSSFSVLPMPYSLPVPGHSAASAPFPVSFPFPYLMQYVQATPDGQEQNLVRPFNNSTLSMPFGHSYPTLQVPPPDVASSWIQVLQPSSASPLNSSNAAVSHSKISAGSVEDKSRPQGLNVHENGISTGMSASGSHPLYKAASLNFQQDPIMAFSQSHQGPDPRLASSLSVPKIPQFGPLRTASDPVDLKAFKEQGVISAFPGFAASVQVSQTLPGALRLPANVADDGGGRQEPNPGKGETSTAHLAFRMDESNATGLNNVSQEEFGRALGGQFHRGSTNILPMPEGLAQELAGLRPGIPPGLKFGGTGSSPDLPWVSTTGPGPNGRTICGVLYRYSRSQVKIVCACHGRHMSPCEFVQHAGGVDVTNPEKNIVVNPFPVPSQPTSA